MGHIGCNKGNQTLNMNFQIQNESSKSTLWKVGMTIVSYYLFFIVTLLIYTIIGGLIVVALGNPLTDLQKLDAQYFYLTQIIMIVAGVAGIWYGIRHVTRKTPLTKKDPWIIIFWFLFIHGIFIIPNPQETVWPFVILNLLINCAAIYFFSKKYGRLA